MPSNLYVFDLENIPLTKVKDKIEKLGTSNEYLLVFGYKQRIKDLPMIRTIEIMQTDGIGENYLDFQLVAEIVTKTNSKIYENVVVVSNDKGYDAVVNHLNRFSNTKISRNNLEDFLKVKNNTTTANCEIEIQPLTKTTIKRNLHFLVTEKEDTKIKKQIYNFALHTIKDGYIREPKGWKKLILTEFAHFNQDKVYNALKQGGLLEKYNSKKHQLNINNVRNTVKVLKELNEKGMLI